MHAVSAKPLDRFPKFLITDFGKEFVGLHEAPLLENMMVFLNPTKANNWGFLKELCEWRGRINVCI